MTRGAALGLTFAASLARYLVVLFAYFGSSLPPATFLPSAPITWFDFFPADQWTWNPGYWLTPGHLWLMLFWPLAIEARLRLNPSQAFWAAVIAWGLLGASLGAILLALGDLLTTSILAPMPVTAGFVLAMFMSEVLMRRGLAPRRVRRLDAGIHAAIFALLFNAFTFASEGDFGLSKLVLQPLIFGLGASLIALVLNLAFRPKSAAPSPSAP